MSHYFQSGWFIFLLFLLSAFFSGSETALLSLSRAQVKRLSGGSSRQRAAFSLLQDPQKLLATLLVGNMFVNVLLTALCASWLKFFLLGDAGNDSGLFWNFLQPALSKNGVKLSAESWIKAAEILAMLLNILLLTPALIIAGELSPKILAYQHNQKVAKVSAFPLLYFGKLIKPLLWALQKISSFWQMIFRLNSDEDGWSMLSAQEVAAAFAAGEAGGVTSVQERELLERIMRFGNINASDIMVPRTEINGISDQLTVQQAYQIVQRSRYNLLPIYHQDMDDIWAVLAFAEYPQWINSKEKNLKLASFRNKLQKNTGEKLPVYEVSFEPPSAKIDRILDDMRKQRIRFTVIVGEYGGTLGIVTVSSILEEIIGRFAGSAEDLNLLRKLPGNDRWLVDGRARLRLIASELNVEFEVSADTVGGLIMALLGRVPVAGEKVEIEQFSFTVQQMAANRIGAVIIEKMPEKICEEETQE